MIAAIAIVIALGFTMAGAQEGEPDENKLKASEKTNKIKVSGMVEDIPLQELIRCYSEETGRTVMYDPKRVAGAVTMVATSEGRELSANEAVRSALADFRLVIVSDGVFDKIIPAAEACTSCETITLEELKTAKPLDFVRVVVPLQSIDANALRGAIQNYTSRQGGAISQIPGINAVVICDFVENLRSLIKAIEILQDESGLETRVVALKNVQYASIQDAVFSASRQQRRPGGLDTSVGYAPNTKSVVITGQPDDVDRIAELIGKLDKPKPE